MNMNKIYVKSIYVPTGDLTEDYIMINLKIKVQIMITGFLPRPDLLLTDVTMGEMLKELSEEYKDILVKPTGTQLYIPEEKAYKFDFYVKIDENVIDINEYMNSDDIVALPIVMEYEDDGHGEYTVLDKINHQGTYSRFENEYAVWYSILDIQEVDTLDALESIVQDDLYITVECGELMFLVIDASDIPDVEVVDYDTL